MVSSKINFLEFYKKVLFGMSPKNWDADVITCFKQSVFNPWHNLRIYPGMKNAFLKTFPWIRLNEGKLLKKDDEDEEFLRKLVWMSPLNGKQWKEF